MLATMSSRQRKGRDGFFVKETPSLTGTTGDIHTWFAGWHLDNDFSVTKTNEFVDILRNLSWTAADLRQLSVQELLAGLNACGYNFEWAARFAADMQRAITLKDLISLRPEIKDHDLPMIRISPNKRFIRELPGVTATETEVRAWLNLWFNHRPREPEFKLFATKFEYQAPESLVGEVPWNGARLLFLTTNDLDRSILGRNLRPVYRRALAADIRAARQKLKDNIGQKAWKNLIRDHKGARQRHSV
ncbi:hypothetical protein M430DRAFT_278386 [Amorphotheca resinae ATCC 22711]|uniref:Uncharacterized protein n=1 Tax=Amorphotheca resinae ATCC 22711 TaxID=857342 RepID=A0A2T3AXJ2_AMORE|nr:hypothetical protein M430DRAFT_278386 [Amorphotheca resinae ATCC 22711]PSS13350.1 hypothetical protein M430DRAFT_278386 [Amorphotheca resinae ATCC 22711]